MSDAIAEIKRLYFSTTRSTIQRDFDTAIDLLKTLGSEEERERVAVYMEGLAAMRSEWAGSKAHSHGGTGATRRPPKTRG